MLSRFFIDRPIFATVLSIVIVLIGAISYIQLPVAQYPEIAPPTVSVTATYPGASAEVVADTVSSPIEQQINGVEGMLYMLSQSTGDGRVTITVTFQLGTDLDEAQVLVQNRVSLAEPRLPEIVRALGVTTRQNSPDLMMVVHLVSPDDSRDRLYISNYASTQITDRLTRIGGVGQVTIFGERAYSMRVWLDPNRMSARNLTAGEVVAALRANNLQVAAGTINQSPVPVVGAFRLNVETQGRLATPEDFANIIVRTGDNGEQVRVSDIGRVELGAQNYSGNGFLDGRTAIPIGIFQRPGSNALETSQQVIDLMEQLSTSFPPGLEHRIVYNPTEFIEESVDAVITTILEAVLLVIVVIIVFLQSWRAAIIPIIAIPISLIGTFFVMSSFGFSINNLTLFGLVLAVGIVVDDAIVVVENVERKINEGMSPYEAAKDSMKEVSGALIATSFVLLAVFVPTAFITGITGQFFRQFAVTIATATVISSIVSLTLSPAMASLFLQSKEEKERGPTGALGKAGAAITWPLRKAGDAFNWMFDRFTGGYAALTRGLIRLSLVVLAVYGGLLYLTGQQFAAAPQGFIPAQDQGYLIAAVALPPGASLDRTEEVMRQADEVLRGVDGIANTIAISGLDGATFTLASNAGVFFLTLDPFDERAGNDQMSAGAIQGRAFGAVQQIMQARIFVIAPPPVRGIGSQGGWKLYVQDARGRGLPALEGAIGEVVAAANQRSELAGVRSQFDTRTPALFAEIDRVKAQKIGVLPRDLYETLEVYLGSAFVNDFNFIGRTYRVTAQADGVYRDTPGDIMRLKARSKTGNMVPLGSIVTITDKTGAYRVPRYNLFAAGAIQGATQPGFSTGEAITAMEEVLDENLPLGFSYEWTELALQEKLSGNTAIYAFIAAVVFVFLVLAAQYESWMLPMAVVLIVPMCLLSAIVGVIWTGLDVNILVQIGLVVLVGLASKNAILIVEFAKQAEDEGRPIREAAREAARLRLRPIVMTSFAFILGVVPLMIATGPGAEMRQSLGTSVFYGMLGVTVFGLLFTPVFYVVCRVIGDWTSGLLGRAPYKQNREPSLPWQEPSNTNQ
ncbi:efflux RND transporter permease subunit [Ahrensia sp. R2A130]|uniref:efflux RND transporter permease subunit n=1 Tax=Ahrensia sp. R2A130 TaxID=744979 RepID=UPI0001E0E921|nr:multidrug efflux RND transporter permease subunit [Ahrensia sp. R2A130]EFL87496.1 hydrophobe/amphiphile efflux-1 [Ahrensia sp. R2A130]